jgi:hypothetical protein
MTEPSLLNPSDLGQERLQAIYERAELETRIDDGDLIVTDGLSCYAIPTRERDRILLLALVGVRDDAEPETKLEFVNRVNNEISTIRARVNAKGRVLFDYHIPVDGGITEHAIVLATKFFLNAVAYAAGTCDEGDILR